MARILITSGPTRQHLDPVRYLTNASSGRMGAAIVQAAVDGRPRGDCGQRAGRSELSQSSNRGSRHIDRRDACRIASACFQRAMA